MLDVFPALRWAMARPLPSRWGSTARPRSGVALLCLLVAAAAHAQGSNIRTTQVLFTSDTLRLDSMSIVPGSLSLWRDSIALPEDAFALDPYPALLVRLDPSLTDTLTARYRVMPLRLGGTFAHKDPQLLLSKDGDRFDPFKYIPPRQESDLLGVQGLNKTGSISRGVLFGNNQDLAVNSALNLELSGRLTDRINVLASITDNNIPIQAGGNTLELQDFDQVFIKLYEETGVGTGWDLVAGDFVLQRPNSHFMTYLKKTKGLSFTDRSAKESGFRNMLGASAAISKGKFARNLIQGVEGVQGPYRLRGNDGETFIIVLSGTERVFIDGQLMVRGQENDYVIDYNTAELTFTANRLVTKDRRIAVEFQYSDRNYTRSLVRFTDEASWGDTRLRLNVYSEQDHRNQSLQQTLGEEERAVLAAAGDDRLAATVPGADSVAFEVDLVLYKQVDSLGYSPVYVYTTDPERARLRVVFSPVGAGQGDYVQQEFTPNGRVFRWVAPDTVNGTLVRRGDHAPVRVLIPPNSQQLITLGVDHKFSKHTKGTVELAFSNFDRNTFSTLDRDDDQGLGIMTNLEHAIPVNRKDSSLQVVMGADVEAFTKHFRVIERFRPVEFERNWNLSTDQASTLGTDLGNDQILTGAHVGLRGAKLGRVSYGLHTLQVPDRYQGWKHEVVSDLRPGRMELIGSGSLLRTTEPTESTFQRHKFRLARRMKWATVGLLDEYERNLFTDEATGALTLRSYQFHDWEAFVQSPDTARNKWRLSGGQRHESAIRDGSLVPSTVATAYSALVDLARNPRNRLRTSLTYRQLSIIDSSLTPQRPEDTWLARIDYALTVAKGLLVMDMFYELGSGLEPRREYIYLQVPPGQGLYVWIDYNGDGIKDLNEFELAPFGYEADHVRVFVPSDNYERVFSNQFSTSLDFRPKVLWTQETGLKAFLAKFSDMASMRVDRKAGPRDVLDALNPLQLDPTDTSLTAYSSSVRNTVYYDRTSRTWSVDHTYQNDRSRNLLLNGFESRSRERNTVRLRWNLTRKWTSEMEMENARVGSRSDLLSGRDFLIDQRDLRPKITWQPGVSMRASLTYRYTEKENRIEGGGQNAVLQDIGAEVRFNAPGKGGLQINANLVRIDFDGEVNSPLGTEMLGGLKPGINGTWTVVLQRNLSQNLQVDLTYNGRRSEGIPLVHVGGAQVRAFF